MIEVVAETGSTNADLVAKIVVGEALAEGYWLVADRQTSGKGRQGRDWSDLAGNFMGSTVVRLSGGEENPSALAFVAALAAYQAVMPHLLVPSQLELKWPNDLMLSGAKLAGILLERHGDSVVVGIGVNLSSAPRLAGRTTISLAQFGPAPDRDIFAADLAAAFAEELARWRTYGLAPLLDRWLAAGHPEGTPLTVHAADTTPVSGTFAGLAPDGALRLCLPDGQVRVIHAGDVTRERTES